MNLKIKIFADGAKLEDFRVLAKNPWIKGYTTNPSLMKKAGIVNYEAFIGQVMPVVGASPISFEVFADDFESMKRQALKLSAFGQNVYVKIPITNTKRESSAALISELIRKGIKINVTALLTIGQVEEVADVLGVGTPSIVSVFAGRIADTGVDPMPMMRKAAQILQRRSPNAELLWASSRELINIFQAQDSGCQIITVTPDILKKLPMVGKDLSDLSLDTVKMFYQDAASSGFLL